jgi:hypothetical protein
MKKLIPFSWTPASWGLKGKSRAIAQAEYEHTGAELEIKLCQIEREHALNGDAAQLDLDLESEILEIRKRHDLIPAHAYQEDCRKLTRAQAELDASKLPADSAERKLAELEIQYRYDDMTDNDYNRERATIQGEPWVDVVQVGFEDSDATKGYFELDWNDEFVQWLSSQGIVGRDDEDTVNKWFNSVCRTVLIQELQDQDYGMQTEGRPDVEYRTDKPGKTGKDDGGDTTDN